MAVDVKTLIMLLILISILRDVCVVPVNHDLNKTKITKRAVLSNKNDSLILLRVKEASAKVGKCSIGEVHFQGKCRAQQKIQQILDNDNKEIVTETLLYEVVPLRKERPKGEKNDASTTEMYTTTSVVTLHDVGTENTSDTNDMKVYAVSPLLNFKEDKTVMMNNVMVFIVCSCAFVLIWLLKFLYDSYLRKEDDTALFSGSSDDMLASTSSRTFIFEPQI